MPITLPFPKPLLSPQLFAANPSPGQVLMAGRGATAVPFGPILHSWCWGAQHPTAPMGLCSGTGTPDMDAVWYKPPERPQK